MPYFRAATRLTPKATSSISFFRLRSLNHIPSRTKALYSLEWFSLSCLEFLTFFSITFSKAEAQTILKSKLSHHTCKDRKLIPQAKEKAFRQAFRTCAHTSPFPLLHFAVFKGALHLWLLLELLLKVI